jgi:hypothetical protein
VRNCAHSNSKMTKNFLSTTGRLGATVTGTIRVQLAAIPKFN